MRSSMLTSGISLLSLLLSALFSMLFSMFRRSSAQTGSIPVKLSDCSSESFSVSSVSLSEKWLGSSDSAFSSLICCLLSELSSTFSMLEPSDSSTGSGSSAGSACSSDAGSGSFTSPASSSRISFRHPANPMMSLVSGLSSLSTGTPGLRSIV